jgi:hypothetical protein
MDPAEAWALLRLRPGACAAEVQRAYRRLVRDLRPDLGGVDGAEMHRLTRARAVALAAAGGDRRRRPRVAGTRPQRAVVGLRRATWAVTEPRRSLDAVL